MLIKFTFIRHDCESRAMVKEVLTKAFNLRSDDLCMLSEYRNCGSNLRDKTIICTPEQFSRFIIYRHRSDMKNYIMEMDPQVIDETLPVTIFDFSNRE